jgi:cytochrome b pre-mRNA-processing protein 3
MGVGDLTVPKEMRRMGEAFYGRTQAYQAALAVADDGRALVETVARNIYGGSPSGPAAAARLAAYIRVAVGDLKAQDPASLAAGELRLPDPNVIPVTTG